MTDRASACWLVALLAGCGGASGGPGGPDGAAGAIDASDPTGDGGGDDGPDGGAPLGPPTWSSEMTSVGANEFYVRTQPEGAVERNLADADADDGFVARLRFPGLPALGTADRVSPTYATELATNAETFHYGTYRMRVKLAACAPGEEVVNGLFTYFNDGTDHDDDGMVDNSEIDIEVLCATPDVVFLSVWTEYTFATETFRKHTRAIDLATGDLWSSPSDHEYGLDRIGNDPALRLPTLLDPGGYVELGFEWHADRVRYFAVIDGADRTLWVLDDAAAIPSLPTAVMFNVWHPGEHWFGGGAAPDYPAQDATMRVDWVRYWAD